MSDKIIPRNLTARAAKQVVGNPASTRLESGVGNCYPGLEFDHRNLDRRFFPGLVFDYVSRDDASAPNPLRQGARLQAIDLEDPELVNAPAKWQTVAAQLRQALNGAKGDVLGQGVWFLSAVKQGERCIELSPLGKGGVEVPLDGMVVWRLIRCLVPGDVDIVLTRRPLPPDPSPPGPAVPAPPPATLPAISIRLKGWRRLFTDKKTGVIGSAYRPGELSQSLCSPWQHDFRDCGCHYWASNHPDIVLVEDRPGEATLPGGAAADPRRALTRVDWLRSDRARQRSAAALNTMAANRPFEMDHYEINRRWQDLAIVLGNKEIASTYRPHAADAAQPFDKPDDLAEKISYLATLEHVLALEYLYALYSVHLPNEVDIQKWPTLANDVTFIRHFILLVATSEMLHLRWANQLLWELAQHDLIKRGKYPAQLGVAEKIPVSARKVIVEGEGSLRRAQRALTSSVPSAKSVFIEGGGERQRDLRPLTRATLADFIAVEQPSGFIEGQYARVTATLRRPPYPPELYQLASRIVNDGVEHFLRFREIDLVMQEYPEVDPPYLRPVQKVPHDNKDVIPALDLYKEIIDNLRKAYNTGAVEYRAWIVDARTAMTKLSTLADQLGAKGIGVPYFPEEP